MNGKLHLVGRVMAVALVTLLLAGLGTEIAAAADEEPFPDYQSAEHFKGACEYGGGNFSGDGGEDGDVFECIYPEGDRIECDLNGKNCSYTPELLTRPQEPTVSQRSGNQKAALSNSPSDGSAADDVQHVAPAQQVDAVYQR